MWLPGDAIRASSNHLLQVLQAFFNLTAVPLSLDEHGHALYLMRWEGKGLF